MAGLSTHNIKHQYSTNTTTSTTSSTISHLLSTKTTTTKHSHVNTTNPTSATNYRNTQNKTTQTHTIITTKTKNSPNTHILNTLPHQSAATTISTSTTPPLCTSYDTSPFPMSPNPPSTTTSKCKNTPSIPQTKHLPFTFHFISNLQTKFAHESCQTLHLHTTQCRVIHH